MEIALVKGRPRINFLAHQMIGGAEGAAKDFQQMISLLVKETFGDGRMIFANPGDWGIDVLTGNLSGRVSVWQTKYFVRGVGRAQVAQIRNSFSSVREAASVHGFTIDRWVLCVPASLDASSLAWWQAWQAQMQAETAIILELWDETELRSRLIQPGAASVYQHYYANEIDIATKEVDDCLFDVWSTIEYLAGRPDGQIFVERLARLTGIGQTDLELSKKTRNDLAHRGHGGVPVATAIRALSIARDALVKISTQVTPLSKNI